MLWVVFSLLIGCSFDENSNYNGVSNEYIELLQKFPVDNQGGGYDPLDTGVESHHATAYAQILSSESFHYKNFPNMESSQRIRKAVKWLLDNADLDKDGKAGWGFPFAWDAFGDGSVNPVNQPYTIDTALVAIGLLDTLAVEGFWSPEEKLQIINSLRDVFTRWCNEAYTQTDDNHGYYRYSTNQADDYNVVNVSSMFAGGLQRFLAEYGYMLNPHEIALYSNCADSVAKSIIEEAFFKYDGPFWNYIESPLISARTNDLVHHVYILFGMDMYRIYGGKEQLSWTTDQSMNSLDLFFSNSKLFNFPQDASFANPHIDMSEPANLWGIGMLMAYYAKSGRIGKYEQCLIIIKTDYGQYPNVTIFPSNQGYYHTKDTTFYPRFAAHVLYGLAVKDFYAYAL